MANPGRDPHSLTFGLAAPSNALELFYTTFGLGRQSGAVLSQANKGERKSRMGARSAEPLGR